MSLTTGGSMSLMERLCIEGIQLVDMFFNRVGLGFNVVQSSIQGVVFFVNW